MFRTIKLKLPYDRTLIETAKQFKEAAQIVLDYGFENKTFNKNKLNKGTYRSVIWEFQFNSSEHLLL